MITAKNLPRHELIGLDVEVVESKNKKQVGIKGRVVDETKNTLVIFDGREKRIEKKSAKFAFKVSGKKIIVDGSLLVARPEDRIKIRVKKW